MTEDTLFLQYRGSLSSCNYDCPYCPFAKQRDTRATLAADAAALARFVDWVRNCRSHRLNLLFTPWGEALTRRHYREALVALSHLPHVERAAIQTNLSNSPDWLAATEPGKLALWCSYHPGETPRARFLARVGRLAALGVPHCVGMVALRAHFPEIRALREALPPHTYLWFNAYWDEGPDYYSDEEARWLQSIDPWFAWNLAPAPSKGVACLAGERALSVDATGTLRRCHFVPDEIGNLYRADWSSALQPRPCPNTVCDCYIGYVHRRDTPFHQHFGVGAPGRIPLDFAWKADDVAPTPGTTRPRSRGL